MNNQLYDELCLDAVPAYTVPKPFLNSDVVKGARKSASLKKAINDLYMFTSDLDDAKWSDNWPVSRPFNPHLVPLPVR